MAENKAGFLLYADYIDMVSQLPDELAGRLFKLIFQYVNDENPEPDDLILKIAFEPIKNQLKRDLKKYEQKRGNYAKAGSKSAAMRISQPQLYVLRMFLGDEEFLKVGVTEESIGKRYSSSGKGTGKLKYKFEVLHQVFGENNVELESAVRDAFKGFNYTPTLKFPGYTECYEMCCFDDLVSFLTTFNVVEQPSTSLNNVEQPTSFLTVTDNVNVTVTVNDNVTVSEKTPRTSLIDVYFTDLPNSTYFEQACRDLGKPRDQLIKSLPEFRKACRTAYKDMPDFADHFKFWMRKREMVPEQPITNRPPRAGA